MSHSPATKRSVFVAYRPIFTGLRAEIRQAPAIRKVVEEHGKSFKTLIDQLGLEPIIEILKLLLGQSVFESNIKAKIAFPELFHTLQVRDAQHTVLEQVAARPVAEAMVLLPASDPGDSGGEAQAPAPIPKPVHPKSAPTINGTINGTIKPKDAPAATIPVIITLPAEAVVGALAQTPTPTLAIVPSLYPSYLSYKVQHLLLSTAQRQLEGCAFEFANKWFPSLLTERGWDCAESVELTQWTRLLSERCCVSNGNIPHDVPASAILNESEVPLDKIFLAVETIRHTAVHRLPTPALGILGMLGHATRLASTLGDRSCAAKLEDLYLETARHIQYMEENKDFLQTRCDAQIEDIARQRAELDRMEIEAGESMLKKDRESVVRIGETLATIVGGLLAREMGEEGLLPEELAIADVQLAHEGWLQTCCHDEIDEDEIDVEVDRVINGKGESRNRLDIPFYRYCFGIYHDDLILVWAGGLLVACILAFIWLIRY